MFLLNVNNIDNVYKTHVMFIQTNIYIVICVAICMIKVYLLDKPERSNSFVQISSNLSYMTFMEAHQNYIITRHDVLFNARETLLYETSGRIFDAS